MRLFEQFTAGQNTLHGVSVPYAGWFEQMTNGQCQPTVAQALLPYPQFCGNLTAANENAGYSSYHSFQAKAEKRMTAGFMFLASYTWSKFISSGIDQQFGAAQTSTPACFRLSSDPETSRWMPRTYPIRFRSPICMSYRSARDTSSWANPAASSTGWSQGGN